MDNLTHTLVGVTLANAGLKERFGRGTTLALAVASNIPDLDVFGGFFHPGPSFLYRRMFTHSLLALPFLSAAFAALFRLAYPNLKFRAAWGLWALGMALHVCFDLINSFGVCVLYPLSRHRFELSSVFIIDLALWALMLAPLFLRGVRALNLRETSRVAAGAVAVYLAACVGLRWRSTALLDRASVAAGVRPSFRYVFPEPFGPERFRGVTRQDDLYRVYKINPITGAVTLMEDVRTDDAAPDARRIAESPRGRGLLWFAKAPVFEKLGAAPGGARWSVYDLRFGSVVLRGRKSFFRFTFDVTGDAVTPLGRGTEKPR